jgi:hypothetical protein
MCEHFGIKAKPTTSCNQHNTSECNHCAIAHKRVGFNDMLRSIDLENIHENLKEKMIIPLITSFNQLHEYQPIRSTNHTTL